jgi:hypothetical protein
MIDAKSNPVQVGNPLSTKRIVMAQVSVCQGCCCGNIGRGKPEVPVERLKHEWRSRGLSKFIQLTISGCLGPCDIVNVIRISSHREDVWVGNYRSIDDYLDLVDWAEESKIAGELQPLSSRLLAGRFNPFCQFVSNGEHSNLWALGVSHSKGLT